MDKDIEWLKDKIKDEERNLKYVYDNYVPYENVLIADDVYDLIDQLDEPEKPVIPQFIANWIESYRKKTLVELINDAVYSSDEDSQCFRRWFHEEMGFESNYDEFLSRVWLDGYEVEKEPQWVVLRNCMYIKNFYFGEMNNDYRVGSIAYKEQAMVFTDKAKAEAVALLVDGEVEEVTE